MIDLYAAPTPNTWKVAIALEEMGLSYTVRKVSLSEGEQKLPEYVKINPNGRTPTIVDRDAGDFAVFESGAILLYLAEKTGKFLPKDVKKRSQVIQWLMFQMGGVGPMQGQANVFFRYFPEKIPSVIQRYQNETRRLYTVLDTQLKGREFIVDDYSIADMATWPWVRIHWWAGVEVDGLDNLKGWMDRMAARPACQKAVVIPEPFEADSTLSMAKSIVTR